MYYSPRGRAGFKKENIVANKHNKNLCSSVREINASIAGAIRNHRNQVGKVLKTIIILHKHLDEMMTYDQYNCHDNNN